MTGAANAAILPARSVTLAQAMPSLDGAKSDLNEQVAFSELLGFLGSEESVPSKPESAVQDSEDGDPADEPSPMLAEITHHKWFAEELSTAEGISLVPKQRRPMLCLADLPAGANSEAVQRSLPAQAQDNRCDWLNPLPTQGEHLTLGQIPMPERPLADGFSAEAGRTVRPAMRDDLKRPAFKSAPERPSQPTAYEAAQTPMQASLMALETVLARGGSPLVREASLSAPRQDPAPAPISNQSPVAQIAYRIGRELDNTSYSNPQGYVAAMPGPRAVKLLNIELNPPELGRVTVRITSRNEAVHLQLDATRPETAKILDNDKDALFGMLRWAGHLIDSLSVQLRSQDVETGDQPFAGAIRHNEPSARAARGRRGGGIYF